jgi:hypothetical protein
MAFGAFIIGDEILVGKRQDKHLAFLIEALARRGLRLAWCQYLGDDPARITAALVRSFAAEALGVPLALHPQAEREKAPATEKTESPAGAGLSIHFRGLFFDFGRSSIAFFGAPRRGFARRIAVTRLSWPWRSFLPSPSPRRRWLPRSRWPA